MIENENEFRLYMERFGPNGKNSQSNYISWLKFVSRNGIVINSTLSDNQTIIEILELNKVKEININIQTIIAILKQP